MRSTPAGYQEIAHTADWELEVWAEDLPGLLEQAARGMLHLAGARLQDSPSQAVLLNLRGADAESLMVTFLSELLFRMEQTGLGFSDFQLHIQELPDRAGLECTATLLARPLLALDKEIKAVTYHRLNIASTRDGMHTRIVFDV